MPHLRPTCSDAAARVTNLNISRYMPSFRQGETQLDHHVNTGVCATHEELEHLQRLPSQRPLDRRWDESRGLVFAEHSRILKNHTWAPRRGIVFAGSSQQRRDYATRPSRIGTIGASKPAGQVFGSGGLPSLEKPPAPAATVVPKGAIQEQMEREIRDKEAKITDLKKDMDRQISSREGKIADLGRQLDVIKADHRNLELNIEEDREAFDREKAKTYSRGRRDAERAAAEEAARAVEYQMQQLKAHQVDLRQQLEKVQMELPALRTSMESQVKGRERALAKRTQELESEIAKRYGEINKFDDLVKQNAKESKQAAAETAQKLDEVSRELQRKEDTMQKRKSERGSYTSYRSLYDQVRDERKSLDDKLKVVRKQLNEEVERCITTADADRSQQGSSRGLKVLEKDVVDIRNKLAKADEELKLVGHASRVLALNTRFRDTSIAAESMSASLYVTSINPLKSVKLLTTDEIDDLDAQLQKASNATLREELKIKKDALSAQIVTLNGAIRFAYLDRLIQVLRTLKLETYPNKASFMATLDLRTDLEEAASLARDKQKTGMSHAEWNRHRNALDKLGILAKKQAQIYEIAGQREGHEQRLDQVIDDKIAELLEEVQVRRESLFESHKAARAASKRAGSFTRTPSTSTSSPLIRRTSERPVRQQTIPGAEQYRIDSDQKEMLVLELRNSAATMDAQMRVDKVSQYHILQLRTLDYQIKVAESRAMSRPKTRGDSMLKSKYQLIVSNLYTGRARVEKQLATGYDPWTTSPKSESVSETSSKRRDDGMAHKTSSPDVTQAELDAELGRLKRLKIDPNNGLDAQGKAILDEQIRYLTIKVSEKQLRNLHVKRAALMPEAAANEKILAKLEVEINDLQRAAQMLAAGVSKTRRKVLTRRERMFGQTKGIPHGTFPDSHTITPEINGLNMTPTPTKQAAHASHMGLHFTGELPWVTALRERQLPGETVKHRRSFQSRAQGESSSAHTAAFVDDRQHLVHTHDSSDVTAVSSGKYVVANDISDTATARKAASDDDSAKSHVQVQPALASLSSPTSSLPSTNNRQAPFSNMAESEEETLLAYEIPLEDKRNALIASRNSTAAFWKYSMYKNDTGKAPTRHYCTTFEQAEAQIAKFAGEKVVGFDLEWEKWHSKPGEDSAKRCVSLMQIASEDKIALFHLALFRGGDTAAALLPAALRTFLENPEIIKVGVNIGGDASRLKRCFGVEMRGNIELSHLHKLVTYGETNPAKVNRGLYALANQVKEHLHLPLAKGEVRTSSWSKRLNDQQTEYAASDAYAGLRLFYELERRRKAMVSKPPRPAFHELGLPIMLGDGQTAPVKSRPIEQPVEATEEPLEEPLEESAALQEQEDDSDANSDDFFDNPEDLEALDVFLESQDAAAAAAAMEAGPSLPEISYPTLPPLSDSDSEPSSSPASNSNSSLPSDPLIKPKPKPSKPITTNFPSPEAATADAWCTTLQQTPKVSKQALRAYHLWHHQGFALAETAALLRKEPLALSTVVSYIAEVLQKEGLEFDGVKVREVRSRLPVSVRYRYERVYAGAAGAKREKE